MRNGRMSLKNIYADMLNGNHLGTDQEEFLADAVYGDNVERVAWELVSLGDRGWRALQNLWFNTRIAAVRDYVKDVLAENQADSPVVQMRNVGRHPGMQEVYDKKLLFGDNLSEAKQLVYRGAKPDVVMASAYA